MFRIQMTKKQRLYLTICISFSFFITELVVGFLTHSLALVADAFHYLSDLVGIVVALTALIVQERSEPAPQQYTFGYQRASLLGAFFNGVFLLALSVSIFVQAIERFVDITPVNNPKLVLIVGSIGLGLNVLVLSFLHEHDHGDGHSHGHKHDHEHEDEECQEGSQVELTSLAHQAHKHNTAVIKNSGRDLGMFGVFVHVVGDAINNIGVVIAAVVIWQTEGHRRYYIDPAISVFIAIMILLSAIPLTKNSGAILLQIAPPGIDLEHVKHDMEQVPGIQNVHELHIWRLDQQKTITSAHIVLKDNEAVENFAEKAKVIMECLHAYGIHSATLQPEVLPSSVETLDAELTARTTGASVRGSGSNEMKQRKGNPNGCQVVCSNLCETKRCCL
ncbi:cation efflux protein [Mariannaea sp. PMI_226]|nr:cation efflux protein [Mariannaea sp. PMI_226]